MSIFDLIDFGGRHRRDRRRGGSEPYFLTIRVWDSAFGGMI